MRPKTKAQSKSDVHLKIETVAIYEEGFVIKVRTKYDDSKTLSNWGPDTLSVSTFDVKDGEGHRYASWGTEGKLGGIFRRYRGHLSLTCWPTLGNTHELILESPNGISVEAGIMYPE